MAEKKESQDNVNQAQGYNGQFQQFGATQFVGGTQGLAYNGFPTTSYINQGVPLNYSYQAIQQAPITYAAAPVQYSNVVAAPVQYSGVYNAGVIAQPTQIIQQQAAPLTQSYFEYVPYEKSVMEQVAVEQVQYVPVEKKYVEQVAVPYTTYVPVEKKVTDYYAVEHQIEHVPQQRYQTYIEQVPVQRVQEKIEYVAVPKQEYYTEYVPTERVQAFTEYVQVEKSIVHPPVNTGIVNSQVIAAPIQQAVSYVQAPVYGGVSYVQQQAPVYGGYAGYGYGQNIASANFGYAGTPLNNGFSYNNQFQTLNNNNLEYAKKQ